MPNTRRKGRNAEARAKRILEAAGYDVQLAPMPTRWARQQDMWGLWDLVAVRASDIRFVQVKCNNYASRDFVEAVSLWKCPASCTKEIWRFVDGEREPIIRIIQ